MNFAIVSTFVIGSAWIAAAAARGASADLRNRMWRAALAVVMLAWVPLPLPEGARISVGTEVSAAISGMPTAKAIPWLGYLWAAGTLVVLARLGLGWIGLARIGGSARRYEDGVYLSDAVPTPVTWGVFHPLIVLPADAADWPAEDRARALRHERAHMQRRDWAWQILGQLLAAAIWFHPLVWLALSEMRREAELAADDAVLRDGGDADAYASQLVRTARRAATSAPLTAVAMVRPGALEARVAAILSGERERRPAALRSRLAIVAAAALLLVPMSVLEAAKTHRVGEKGLTPPKLASKVDPQYTEEAQAAKLQGTTTLSLIVTEKGLAEKIQVKKSLDKGLDAKAIEAVKQWRFEPGTLNGKPVRVAAMIEVNFRLL